MKRFNEETSQDSAEMMKGFVEVRRVSLHVATRPGELYACAEENVMLTVAKCPELTYAR